MVQAKKKVLAKTKKAAVKKAVAKKPVAKKMIAKKVVAKKVVPKKTKVFVKAVAKKAIPKIATKAVSKTKPRKTTSLAGKKRVRFEIQAENGGDVYVVGSFNDWNPQKDKLTFKNGVYGTNLLLSKGRYEYKFMVGDVWCVDPSCAEWAPNGLGSLNSVIVVG